MFARIGSHVKACSHAQRHSGPAPADLDTGVEAFTAKKLPAGRSVLRAEVALAGSDPQRPEGQPPSVMQLDLRGNGNGAELLAMAEDWAVTVRLPAAPRNPQRLVPSEPE